MSCANESSPSIVNAGARRGRTACAAVACWMLLFNAAQAAPVIACKPLLSTRDVRIARESPVLPYDWKVTVLADAKHCATRSGMFEVDFILTRELGPDVQFTERFRWTEGRFEISIEFAGDETVLDHRIGFVAPCVCREIPFE
jgi:hypothetical protein